MDSLQNYIVAGLTSGTVVALIIGFLLHRAKTTIGQEVENRFKEALEVFKSEREWKEASLSKLLGPVVMHLERTLRVSDRYSKTTYNVAGKSYPDAMLMKESNEAIRSILLTNGHLIPENLLSKAHTLVAHYDLWLSRFILKFNKEKPTVDSVFDIGFAEEPFPEDAVRAFKSAYASMRNELYKVNAEHAGNDIGKE